MNHWAIDNVNYARDARNRAGERTVVEIDGVEHELPTKWAVCSVCNGEGSHANPAVDCNGLSAEDFADDPDFAEGYMSGDYDVGCNRCEGRRVERVVDWAHVPKKLRKAYERAAEADRADEAERMMEIRMGC
jgi:hypothetical protein